MWCKGRTQSLLFVHCSVTAHLRIVAVSRGLENPPLDNCNWKATRTGLQGPPPYLEKIKWVAGRVGDRWGRVGGGVAGWVGGRPGGVLAARVWGGGGVHKFT